MIKICCTCKQSRNISIFSNNKVTKDGYSAQCKICAKEYRDSHKEQKKFYPSSSKEYRKEYNILNKEQISKTRKIGYVRNKDKMKEQNKNNYLKHRDARLVSNQEYYKNNLEYFQIKSKIYREEHRQQIYLRNRARRLKLKNSTILQLEIDNLVILQNNLCYYCDILLDHNIQIDHYVPLSKNGEHKLSNLVACCKKCNLEKGNKLVEEWYFSTY